MHSLCKAKFAAAINSASRNLELRRDWKVARGAAYQLSLPLCGVKEAKAVLEALAIANLRLEGERLIDRLQLKFHLHHLADGDVARNHGAEPAFAQILAAAVQDFSAANE